jgi:alkyl hydroperoxide reductase subunit AhpC
MIELGELESHFQEFKNRKNPVDIIVISTDDRENAQKSQAQFSHLTVVADTDQKMCETLDVMDPKTGTAAPTTILVDGQGTVRWVFRPDRFLERLSPAQVLAAIDEHMPKSK